MISETTPAIELPQRFSDQTRRSSKPEVISIIKKDPVSIKSIGNAKMMNSLEENISRAKNVLPYHTNSISNDGKSSSQLQFR